MDCAAQESKSAQSGNKLWKQLLALVFAGVLLWFAFRGTNLNEVWADARNVNPFYLVLLCLNGVLSHILRAWRWIYLLKPLSDKKVGLFNSFSAVIFGYAVNIAIPRGGEVARLVSISKSEKLPWAGVLSTMFIDRLLDVAVLGMLLGLTLNLLPDKLLKDYPALVPGGTAIAIASVVALVLLPKMSAIMTWLMARPKLNSILPAQFVEKIANLSQQFEVGTKSLSDRSAYPVIAISTAMIWTCYGLNNWILILGFHLQDRVPPLPSVNLLQSLVVFTIGSLGVLVPTPGSAGSFHMLVKLALMYTCGLDENLALSFAIVLHLFSFIVVPCATALACWLWQVLRPSARTSPEGQS